MKSRPITYKDAAKFLANCADEFIHLGGEPTAIAGHDRFRLLQLADCLERFGYDTAEAVRAVAVKTVYPQEVSLSR